MKNKLYIVAIAFLLGIANASAQDESQGNDRMESIKIAFITERLSLTSKEATVFWPVFNEFSTQQKAIRSKFRESAKVMRTRQDMNESEADKFISEQLVLRQQELDLVKKYTVEFKKVLPAKKVARLMTLEEDFKMQLMKRMQERKGMRNRQDTD